MEQMERRSMGAQKNYTSMKQQKAKIYFITGASGAGKSSLIPYLKSYLPKEKYRFYDFDERGVPTNVNQEWRRKETKHWLGVGAENAKKEYSTIICGLAYPDEVENEMEQILPSQKLKIIFFLLDVSNNALEQRLKERFASPEKQKDLKRVSGETLKEYITKHIKRAKRLRVLCKKYPCTAVDVTKMESQKVAAELARRIVKKL